MGHYYSEYYGFEVKSKTHLMDLICSPSFNIGVCIQFHIMDDGCYKAFYNFAPSSEKLNDALDYVATQYGLDIFKDNAFVFEECTASGLFRECCPVFSFCLNEDEKQKVKVVYEHHPNNVEEIWGCDGCIYDLIVYNDGMTKEFQLWSELPDEWGELAMLINLMVKRLDLEKDDYSAHIRKKKERQRNS